MHLSESQWAEFKKTHPDLQIHGDKPAEKEIQHWSAGIKRGRREDLGGVYFRSKMEANYARYLTFLGYHWTYQSNCYDFLLFKQYRRNTSYLDDFWVIELEKEHEVKGYMTPDSKTKLRRMALHYPEIKIHIVLWPEYKEIEAKLGRLIPGWEW